MYFFENMYSLLSHKPPINKMAHKNKSSMEVVFYVCS